MRKFLSRVSAGLLLGSLAACATRVELTTIEVGPVVANRPPSNLRESRVQWVWRQLELPVSKDIVRKAHEGRLTLALHFTDCSGTLFAASDVYVAGESLFQSHMTDEEFSRVYASLPQTAMLSSYIREVHYQQKSPICVELSGGNMTGQTIQSQQYVLKPG